LEASKSTSFSKKIPLISVFGEILIVKKWLIRSEEGKIA
jgi:hypothetical protein